MVASRQGHGEGCGNDEGRAGGSSRSLLTHAVGTHIQALTEPAGTCKCHSVGCGGPELARSRRSCVQQRESRTRGAQRGRGGEAERQRGRAKARRAGTREVVGTSGPQVVSLVRALGGGRRSKPARTRTRTRPPSRRPPVSLLPTLTSSARGAVAFWLTSRLFSRPSTATAILVVCQALRSPLFVSPSAPRLHRYDQVLSALVLPPSLRAPQRPSCIGHCP